jgi:hypothetical protein
MSDTTTPAETEPTNEQQSESAPADQLGEGGQKALKAERARANAAEKAASDLKAQLDKINQANESAVEKAQRELKDAQDLAARATAEAIRLRVAAKHGISDEDADLFLTATDEESLTRQAERLAARNADANSPRAPKPDANQGRPGAGGPKSTADSFAEFFRNNLSER